MKKGFEDQKKFGSKGIIIIGVALIATALALFFLLQLKKEDPIKIGAIIPLSGRESYIGLDLRDSMLLAAQEINSWGGVNRKKIKLIFQDSKASPEEAKKVFNRIEKAHRPLFYISSLSSVSMQLAPLAEKNRVVLACLVTVSEKVTEGKEWVFRYYPTSITSATNILAILKELKVRKLGILYLNNDYGISLFESLGKGFKKTGGTVRSESFELKSSDFREQIKKLKDMQAVFAVGYPSLLKQVFKQLRQENYQGHILASHAATSHAFRTIPEADGVYVAAPLIYNQNYIFAKEAKEKFEKAYQKPFTHYAANGYDFIKIITGLLEDEEMSRKNIKSILEKGFTYTGVFGDINAKPGEHNISFPVFPARIMGGEIVYTRPWR